jgi:cyclophilin family peptidyl-prolyl cis-trans isomerase
MAHWQAPRAISALALATSLILLGCPNSGAESDAKPAASGEATSAAKATGATDAKGEDVAIAAIDEFITQQKIDTNKPGWKTQLSEPPKVEFDSGSTYYWVLDTNVGNIKVKLLPEVAPMHVSSTIYLTNLGFYDDIAFHRVITGFMAQGGDPLGNGRGGPGYKYAGEFSSTVKHDKPGMLSMANSGPGTDGSQFFLTFVPTPHLDGKHTLFGEVVDGMDTVKKLEDRGSRRGTPSEPMSIEKATIVVE